MFVELIESTAKYLVIEPIRDESLGDMWELEHRLQQQGVPKVLRYLKTTWYFICLVQASMFIAIEEKAKGLQATIATSASSAQGNDLSSQRRYTTLTSDDIETIRKYCATRRLYGPTLSRKWLGLAKETIADNKIFYWLDLTDKIIRECRDRMDTVTDCDAIVNSFIFSTFVRRAEAIPPQQADIKFLKTLVERIDLTDDFINRYVAFSTETYERRLLFQTWSLVVYVISWQPGQESLVHHHGHSLDVIKVIQGEMTHWQMTPDEWKDKPIPFEDFRGSQRCDDYPSETFSKGDVVAVDRHHAHQVANRSSENLVTLHFRLGHPPEDGYWRATRNAEIFLWNQAEGRFKIVPQPPHFRPMLPHPNG